MSSISDYSSKIFIVQLSCSFSLNVKKPIEWKISSGITLNKLMTNNMSQDFIDFDKLEEEGYWYTHKENIEQFNKDIKSTDSKRRERRENMVIAALDYGTKFVFISEQPHDKILETTKLVATGLAARTHMYTHEKLREKIEKYILPELEVEIDERRFLIIPCITLWDSRNNNRKTQFGTMSLIILPQNMESNPIPIDKMYKFVNEISQPRFHEIQIKILNELNILNFKIDIGDDSLSNVIKKLVKGTCNLFNAKEDKSDYTQNILISVICDYYSDNKICSVPDYSIQREFTLKEKEISKVLSSFLYNFSWMDDDPIANQELDILDYTIKLSQDQIIHLPHNVSTFFTVNRHLSLLVLISPEVFPDSSAIWALGSENISSEIMSTQLYLISWYNDIFRKTDNRNISEIRKARNSKIFDFEPFYNLETDDFHLKTRIDKMQSKMGLQQKYKAMNQRIESQSALIIEKENENLQLTITGLTLITAILGVLNIIFLWTNNLLIRGVSFLIGLTFIGIGFVWLKRALSIDVNI